ncbi:MAG: alpha/beta hydrolase [Phormidesmis sp.]
MQRKTVSTSRLEIAYLDDGPADAPPVLLLHGFPDDATAWTPVMTALVERGRRVIVPFVRGCGPTRFLQDETPRAGDFAALGQDALDLVEALDLSNLIVVGQDWGSPTAEIVAMRSPDRVVRLVKLNWYGVYSMAEMARAQGFSYPQLKALWYVWMLNVPLGEMVIQYDRAGFARSLWQEWSPSWNAQARDAALNEVLPSFEGIDWMRVALSAYRANITPTELDPADDALREQLQSPIPVKCETKIITGADDGVERSPLNDESLQRYFAAGVTVRSLAGIGHFPHREAPQIVAEAVLS